MKSTIRFALLAVVLVHTQTARAEVFNCSGVYQSYPCDQQPPPKVERDTTGDRERREKKSVAVDTELALAKVRNDAGIDMNISARARPLYDLCTAEQTTMEQCQAEAERIRGETEAEIARLKAEQQPVEPAQEGQDDEEITVSVAGPGYETNVRGKRGDPRQNVQVRPNGTGGVSAGTGVRVGPAVRVPVRSR